MSDSALHASHFETIAHETHAVRMGMWMFLVSELLLFAGMFVLYAVYRVQYGASFAGGVAHNDMLRGSLNTVILLTSSYTAASAAEQAKGRAAALRVGITILLALAFLGIKGTEYVAHFAQNIIPGAAGALGVETAAPGLRVFYVMYFLLTGTHALHVGIGIGVFAWLSWGLLRYDNVIWHRRLELGVMYWHLVDIIWVFLWPMFYLGSAT